MFGRIHHIAYAVRDLKKAMSLYRDTLGMTIVDRDHLASRQVDVALMQVGETIIELVAPTSPESPVQAYLDKNGEGFFHIAYQVKDIQLAMKALEKCGVRFKEQPRPGLRKWRVAFLDTALTNGVETQLIEDPDRPV